MSPVTSEMQVTLPILAQELDTKVLQKRFGVAYDAAVKAVVVTVDAKAKEYNREILRAVKAKDYVAIGKLIDGLPSDLDLHGFKLNRYANADKPEKVDRFFDEDAKLYSQYVREPEVPNYEDYIKATMKLADSEEVNLTLSFANLKAKSNPSISATLKEGKGSFVRDATMLVDGGVKGRRVNSSFDVADATVASLMARSLVQQIGISGANAPKEAIPFEDAQIPKGHYPVSFGVDGTNVIYMWPKWIGVGMSTVDLQQVPRKT
ncbi:MAG: hypothetical protein ABII22_05450 [Candidatus Micrarchaeota archaeon]